jgi:Zn-dependent alcohol dehydrogenase
MVATKAIVTRQSTEESQLHWELIDVDICAPRNDQVLVEVCATGVCHTDIVMSSLPAGNLLGVEYPKIMGHEGTFNIPPLCPSSLVLRG